jgi:1,2-phenylacetyl-CoA epoxidase PaaB subunit
MRKKKTHRWEISRLKASRAEFIGSVYAADEEAALQLAKEQLRIRPNDPWRLLIRLSD